MGQASLEMMLATPESVLNFWFGHPGDADYGKACDDWFRRSEAFDEQIRQAFELTVKAALAGELFVWRSSPRSALALVIVLDQFTRNLYRNSPHAFAGDPAALVIANEIIDQGWDKALTPVERSFVYLPFEHSEQVADQERSLELYAALAAAHPECAGFFDYAQQHHAIIARFGRFPHRNAALGRDSSPEEISYLAQPGAGF